MQVAYIISNDGNMSIVINGKMFSVGKTHPNYQKIVDELKLKKHDKLEKLIDIPLAISSMDNKGSVKVENGRVLYRGRVLHNTVTSRILKFMSEGLPTDPLIRFLENLLLNPVPEAVEELYDFLDHQGFPITEDGCFVGYKSVRSDWLDHYSGTISNTIGTVVRMDRSGVDPDRRHECSYGLHVGTLEYAQGFGTSNKQIVLVKVNPRDCIAVPKDYDCSKLRVCEYVVLSEAKGLIETPMYPMPNPMDSASEEDDDDPYDTGYDFDDDEDASFYDDEPYVEVEVTTPKRPPCSRCGAKGGKKHATGCHRRKS